MRDLHVGVNNNIERLHETFLLNSSTEMSFGEFKEIYNEMNQAYLIIREEGSLEFDDLFEQYILTLKDAALERDDNGFVRRDWIEFRKQYLQSTYGLEPQSIRLLGRGKHEGNKCVFMYRGYAIRVSSPGSRIVEKLKGSDEVMLARKVNDSRLVVMLEDLDDRCDIAEMIYPLSNKKIAALKERDPELVALLEESRNSNPVLKNYMIEADWDNTGLAVRREGKDLNIYLVGTDLSGMESYIKDKGVQVFQQEVYNAQPKPMLFARVRRSIPEVIELGTQNQVNLKGLVQELTSRKSKS